MRWVRRATVARSLAIPLALIVVASVQLALAHSSQLSPWKGGGFGMFATLDQPQTRLVRIELTPQEGDPVPVALDRYLVHGGSERHLDRARAMPDQQALRRVAEDVGNFRWYDTDGTAVPTGDVASAQSPLDPHEIRVQVWTFTFDRSERRLDPRLLAEHVTAVP